MEQRTKKWKSFGWEGSLALVGALAVGAFGLVGSCESDKSGALYPGGAAGVTGTIAPYIGGDGVSNDKADLVQYLKSL